jgi:phosphoribosylformimino-5-aminoimidazole carboxamide ribotide isomerase
MRIIPAIDILNGKCVRLSQGNYHTQKIYNENPLEVSKIFEDAGLQYLHVVDLDGAKSQHIVNYKVLQQLCSQTNLIVDFGGGIKSEEDIRIAFECGAAQVTVGSMAVADPLLFIEWLKKYSSDKVILGADFQNRKIATTGWLNSSSHDIVEFISFYKNKGVKYVISTDISKDGMLQGPSLEIYREIVMVSNIKLIASGGIASVNDLIELQKVGCEGVIIGKAIYENKISLKELTDLNFFNRA